MSAAVVSHGISTLFPPWKIAVWLLSTTEGYFQKERDTALCLMKHVKIFSLREGDAEKV